MSCLHSETKPERKRKKQAKNVREVPLRAEVGPSERLKLSVSPLNKQAELFLSCSASGQ